MKIIVFQNYWNVFWNTSFMRHKYYQHKSFSLMIAGCQNCNCYWNPIKCQAPQDQESAHSKRSTSRYKWSHATTTNPSAWFYATILSKRQKEKPVLREPQEFIQVQKKRLKGSRIGVHSLSLLVESRIFTTPGQIRKRLGSIFALSRVPTTVKI